MNEEHWRRAWELYRSVLSAPADTRQALIRQSCSDPTLIHELLGLLEHEPEARESEAATRTGTRLGRYEIGNRIGRGGMGEVYAAVDVDLGRPVAIKFLPQSVLEQESAVQRFVAEARSASALNHPNIVTVHEIVREDGVLAIVMEHVQGITLRQAIQGPAGYSTLR